MGLIPILLLIRIMVGKDTSILMWTLKALPSGLYFLFAFIAGYWGFFIYNLRHVFGFMYVGATLWSVTKITSLPFFLDHDFRENIRHNSFSFTVYLIASAVLLYFILKAIKARTYHGTPVHLTFPCEKGRYYVIEGGDSKESRWINYHFSGSLHKGNNVHRSMRYAVDFVKLNSFGCYAGGIFPIHVNKHAIYHQKLRSPCEGTVAAVIDGMDNEEPFTGKHPYNVGNHVSIRTGDVHVVIGHMQKGSILVKEGDHVTVGQEIALVGNSGLTEFPHVHIQAMTAGSFPLWQGAGVPILFDGVFPVKNSIIKRP